jgi:HK97 family phage portal protein
VFNFIKRFFGSFTQYQPGTGRIVAAKNASSAGTQITLESAMSIPAFLHGLRTFGQTVGILDFDVVHHLITTNAEGIEQSRQEIARLHPVHRLLHSEPNEFQNASEWRETMMAHAIATGNGYSYIERNGNFRPTALLPLLPNRTKPIVTNGKLTYVTVVNNQNIELDPWNVFHIKGFSWNGVSGMPLIDLMKNALGLDLAQSQFAAQFYHHGSNMGGVVEMSGALSDEARQNLKSSWHREYEGIGNAFRTTFLEEGMKFTKVGTDPDKAQYIEGRQFSLGDMSRVIGLAPHLLFDLARSTNNNIEHLGITSVQYCFEPWTNKFVQEANRKLLYESEKFEYSTRLDLTKLTRGDSTAQAAVDTARFNTLSITPNEIRAKDGRNPVEGGDSVFLNTAYLPLAVAIAKAVAATATTPALPVPPAPANEGVDTEVDEDDNVPPGDPTAGIKPADGIPGPETPANLIDDERSAIIRPVIRDAISRIIKRESKIIEGALKKHAADPQGFFAWFATFQQEQRSHIAEVLQPVSDAAAAAGMSLSDDYAEQHINLTSDDIEVIMHADKEHRAEAQWSILSSWQEDRTDIAMKQLMGEMRNEKADT